MIDHADLAESRLVTQFKEAVNLIAFIRAMLKGSDDLEAVYTDLLNERWIDTAIGTQLDVLGEIVGIPRPLILDTSITFFGFQGVLGVGAFGDTGDPSLGGIFRDETAAGAGNIPVSDEQYRVIIRAQIIKNTATGTIEEIILSANALLNVDQVIIVEVISAVDNEIEISFDRSLNANEVLLLTELDLVPKAAGVRLTYVP